MAIPINKQTYVKVLYDCPLRPDYEHTINWLPNNYDVSLTVSQINTAKSNQTSYFNNLNGKAFNNNSYQRISSNKIRVGQSDSQTPLINYLYNANYMFIENESYENKRYYAFILDVEYINNNTCEITYMIDVIQTWFFDYYEMPCFIDRTIIKHDGYGVNTTTENIDIGYYYKETLVNIYTPPMYPMFVTKNPLTDTQYLTGGQLFCFGGVYSGLYYYTYPHDVKEFIGGEITQMESIIRHINNDPSGGANILMTAFLVPKDAYAAEKVYDEHGTDRVIDDDFFLTPPDTASQAYTIEIHPKTLHCYVTFPNVKNYKTLQYPYRYITVNNRQGTEGEYKIELFNPSIINNSVHINFEVFFTFSDGLQSVCVPYNYMGLKHNFEYGINGGQTGNIPVISDTFQQWWINNSARIQTGLVTSIMVSALQTGVSLSSPEIAMANNIKNAGFTLENSPLNESATRQIEKSARISMEHGALSAGRGITSVTGAIANMVDASRKADTLACKPFVNTVTDGAKQYGFIIKQKCIDDMHLKIVDDFFSTYGYSIKSVGMPCRNNRNHWTYIKTQNSLMLNKPLAEGYTHNIVPQTDLLKIQKIYDNGITFWNQPFHLGNYNLTNTEFSA